MNRTLSAAAVGAAALALLIVAMRADRLFLGASAPADPALESSDFVMPPKLGAMIIGGGPVPSASEVSIEQDVALARQALPEPRMTLFAGGRETLSVKVAAPAPPRSLRSRLAAFFEGRDDTNAHFRRPEIPVDLPASRTSILMGLRAALQVEGEPLWVYWAGHGSPGESFAENRAELWGGEAVTPRDLGALLASEHVRRQMLLMMTTCYSGGFAELIHERADEAEGLSHAVHCGLFASLPDEEASGCDPNPSRAAQESFGLYFVSALLARDRHGAPSDAADLDEDGRVDPREAHAWAQGASWGIEVPTSTSGRFLRSLELPAAAEAEAEILARGARLLPEEAWLSDVLGEGRGEGLEAAEAWLEDVEARLDIAYTAAEAAAGARGLTQARLRIALLGRFPFVDDPWHENFEALLASRGAEIDAVLTRSPEATRDARALARWEGVEDVYDQLSAERARAYRLVRARESLRLAGIVATMDDDSRARLEALVACERGGL